MWNTFLHLHTIPPTMITDAWFLLVNLCCLAWIIWLLVPSRRRVHPPLPPGPWGLLVLGMLPFLGSNLHSYFARLIQTYGPLLSFRLGTKTVIVVGSPSLAKRMLKDNDVTFSNRDVTASAKELMYGGIDITFGAYGPDWKMLRKIGVSGMLGSTSLDATYDLRRQSICQTMTYLHEHAGRPVNIGEQMFLMTLNTITSTLWGNTVKREDMATLVGADFRRVTTTAVDLLGAPDVSDFFPALARFDLQGVAKRMRDCSKKFDGMIEAIIDQCTKMDTKDEGQGRDLLQVLLEIEDRGDSKTPLTRSHTKALLIDMILAGTDTTSNTIEFAMAELIKRPQLVRKAQQELERVIGAGNLVEESHISQLPYLQSIMKETLRLHPILPLLVPRCPSRSCVVGGYTIPKGAAVFINVWAIHRDPLQWKEPLEFKPERFMNGNHDFKGNDLTYMPFGSGRRICVGVPMAERMILVFLASLLHYFDWELPRGVEEVDFSEKFGFTLKKTKPLLLIPTSSQGD